MQIKTGTNFSLLMKIELEKEHGRQVRLNKEYARTSQSLEMFTGLLSRGVGVGLVFKSLTRSIGGVSKELDKYKAEHKELMRMEQEFAKKGIKIADLGKAGNEQYQEQFRRQQEAVDTAKEGAKGKGGKLAEGISSMKAFADKHKTGILIGAGSIGVLLTVLKKAFDVSPMFQAIKKLLHFGFMLILRPIGDFFGFIMRPIMVMMLRKFIIPWYKDVYPYMKKWGTGLGKAAAGFIATVSDPVAQITAALIGFGLTAAVIKGILSTAKRIKAIEEALLNKPTTVKPPVPPKFPSSPIPKVPKFPLPPKPPVIKLPPVITNTLAKVATLPAVIKSGVASAVTNSVGTLKTVLTPITKALTSPIVAQAAEKNGNCGKACSKTTIEAHTYCWYGIIGSRCSRVCYETFCS